ncbi:myosin I myo5 [Apiospora hydei]|uniref:Myosin I myo5 n=1 Tax=Apiospora hydei TaxID=1337664 RepID=A0ABR1V2Z9_9PEZI
MAGLSALESLPHEIILEILSFLETKDIIHLQRCSRRLLKLSRDNVFWRTRCLLTSSFLEGINLRRGARFPDVIEGALNEDAALQDHDGPDTERSPPPLDFPWASRRAREKEIQKITANWDPSFPGETISWYDEYIHRNSPIAVSWFERPQLRDGGLKDHIEVKGVAVYQHGDEEVFAVSPLDDGSVCLWDIKGTRPGKKKGSILQQSKAGLLRMGSSKSPYLSPDCVSVDNARGRAFFAVQGHVVEVDLGTLQVVGDQPYEWTITTMSSAQPRVPLTIGTLHGIHLHDSRYGRYVEQTRQERIDDFDRYNAPRRLSLLLFSDPLPPYAPLPHSNPLSILHLEQPGNKQAVSDDIFVAGRFSNILNYDRRMFPSIKGSLHSGARLCSLTSLPYPFSSVDSELRRKGELSMEQVEKIKETTGGRTLVACGEYNTKGSLEIYGLGPPLPGQEPHGVSLNSVMKNRQTASKSKLLSVINHGTCLVVSDGSGYLKWVERDGFTEVRRQYIGPSERVVGHTSLFNEMPGSGEIARKLLSTQSRQASDDKSNDDDILLWTGEKLGLVDFSSKQGFTADDFEEGDTRTPEEVAAEQEKQHYEERMRQALERDADGVRLFKVLGAGIRG